MAGQGPSEARDPSHLPADRAQRAQRPSRLAREGCHRAARPSAPATEAMTMDRRDLLFSSGMFLLAGTRALRPGAAPFRAPAQAQGTPQARLLEALRGNRFPLTMADAPAGRGWDWLVKEARDARFTLIGEEHGVAETSQFTAALFNALRGAGYNRLAIELSPIIAQDIEAAARRRGL